MAPRAPGVAVRWSLRLQGGAGGGGVSVWPLVVALELPIEARWSKEPSW
jgi:hypothetical protein